MTAFATSTFLQVTFAMLIIAPIVLLWIAAVVDVIRHTHSGLRTAAMLVLILILPILGPLLYFIAFRRSAPPSAEAAYMAQEDQRRERDRQPIGGMGQL
jgi:Phospholipase_D-nuclease N-terminal